MTKDTVNVIDLFYNEDIITLDEWREEWDTCPIERDYKKRAKKKENQEKFERLHPDHLEVSGVKLSRDCVDPVTGKEYKKGHKFKINGHTRPEAWKMGICKDGQPEQLRCKWRDVDSIDEVRKEFHIYDSPKDVDKAADAVYGAYRNVFTLKNKYISHKKLLLAGPLMYAGCGCFPNDFIRAKKATVEKLTVAALKFEDSLFWLQDVFNDKQFGYRKSKITHQIAMTSAYIMSHQMWKNDEDALYKLKEFILRVSNGAANNDCDLPDTCTHFINEWMIPQQSIFLNHGGVLDGQVASEQMEGYNLLMIDSYIQGKSYKTMPNNWRKNYTTWGDRFTMNIQQAQQIQVINFPVH